ncbi:MAG: hypothetical protein AUG89_01035 [Acidobacteria bacterium 13_1_20CM_4_56_7]|nr:MAG: hypothetical protein AUG89_01035 [Acidobacteria bacterium 13_1_20CM_4_56_7]
MKNATSSRALRGSVFLLRTSLLALFLMLNLRMPGTAAALPQTQASQSVTQSEQTSDEGAAALTIYNQNFFVAREHVLLDLKPGVNEAQYTGVAAHLEPDSVILRDPHGRALQVLEQNYRNDPISQELLLSFYEGKTIDFVVGRNTDGSDVKLKGKVIRSGYVPVNYINGYPQQASSQPIIEVDGVLRFGMPGQPIFPALSADSILKPTLNWLLQTNQPGKFDAEISYVSGGMTWQSDYNVVVQDDPGKKTDLLDMIGWITMHNQSGKTYENARIKLLAGDVSKIQAPTLTGRAYAAKAMAVNEDAMAPPVQEKSFDEFHLYTLQRPTTLRDEETKQVEFVSSAGIHAQRLFIYDGAQTAQYGYYNPDQIRGDVNYGTASNPKVWVMEEFKNSDNNHLGMALPKGKLRFYRRDTDGHLEFVGENTIDHTPKDETIRVYTGNAFDVVGERKRTNYHVDSNQHWMDESFEIRIRNHKKDPVDVRAVEHLYRWTNWKLIQQSSEFNKKNAQTIEFPVTIAPNGERVITYTVHYSW